MFIAQNWKDYEVIDTSDKEKLERWGLSAGSSGPAGYLGYPEGKPWMEKHECPLPQKCQRRRRLGVL